LINYLKQQGIIPKKYYPNFLALADRYLTNIQERILFLRFLSQSFLDIDDKLLV